MQTRLVGTLAVGLVVALIPAVAAAGAEPLVVPSPMVIGEQGQSALPPADSPPLFTTIELRFPNQGNISSVDGQTYLYYMEIDDYVSLPSQGRWTPYDETIEEVVLGDFKRLWDTGFLTDLAIEVIDDPYPNGVVGKRVLFLMEERERVRIVTFTGSDVFDRSEIDEALKIGNVELRLDSRIAPGVVRRTENVLRLMFAGKGYQFAEVSHEITSLAGGPKVVQLTFNIDEGPKVEVEAINFVGNDIISTRALKRQMTNTKERWFLSFLSSRGLYKPFGYEQDADLVVAHYRNNGFIDAEVGQPELEYLEPEAGGQSRGVTLLIPVSEGRRYRIGKVEFDGQEVLRREALERIFAAVQPGRYYSEVAVRNAFNVARESYGSAGYWEMTAFPDLVRREGPQPDGLPTEIDGEPIVDVTLRLEEGEQYFINRITFSGNETTHDEVIRREIGLNERGVFNTEALKFSVRRLNQLGYFEPLEEATAIQVAKRPGVENEVDLTLNLSETNLNQLSFGAGASQYDGFFLQLSFQTTNFMGRGESLTVSAQSGERVKNYNLGFTEPYLFGKPISGSVNLFSRDMRFINQFTQSSVGATSSVGLRTGQWSQMFFAYSYEETQVKDLNPQFLNPEMLRFNPFLQDTLLIGQGARTISKVTPTFRRNTVDHPIFPTTGQSLTLSVGYAGLGGNTQFYKPTAEGTWFLKHGNRLSLGFRAQAEYIQPLGSTQRLPIFELLSMGGENSVRGYDIRSIGPSDSNSGLVIGGNKSLLFNGEYLISIANPVRFVLFYDAGQVADYGQSLSMDLFRTSAGAELRFFMPVLNVPFRLIYAWNIQRGNVLNDRFEPQEPRLFKFAIGTTF